MNNWYDEIKTKDLEKLHTKLNKAVWAIHDELNKNETPAPDWLKEADKDVRRMYDDLCEVRGVQADPDPVLETQ